MFDVPVHEVTVSSAPPAISSIKQANQIPLHTSVQALLHGWSQIAPAVPASSSANANQAQTLLPNDGAFEPLKPLNLVDIANSLEKVFEDSLEELPPPLQPSNELSTPKTTAATPQPSTVSEAAKTNADEPSATTLTPNVAIAAPEKPSTVLPRVDFNQCIDAPYEPNTDSIKSLQVLLQDNLIGEVDTTDSPDKVVKALKVLLDNQSVNPNEINPVLDGDQPAIRLSSDIMLQVPQGDTSDVDEQSTLAQESAIIAWSDQLRQTMGAAPLDAGEVQVQLQALKPTGQKLDGIASWYGPYFHGRITANGETFDQNALTAAHKSLPFDTVLQVRNLENNRTVIVRINDRGPYIGVRSLDLSKAAAQCLGSEKVGLISYEAIFLESPANPESPTE